MNSDADQRPGREGLQVVPETMPSETRQRELLEIGRRLKAVRHLTGLSEKDFAARYATSQATWHRMENGKKATLDAALLAEVCRGETVSLLWVVYGTKPREGSRTARAEALLSDALVPAAA